MRHLEGKNPEDSGSEKRGRPGWRGLIETLVKDPDEQVWDFVQMLFSKVIELGSLSGIEQPMECAN